MMDLLNWRACRARSASPWTDATPGWSRSTRPGHGADLLASTRQPSGDDRFRYLSEEPPADMAAFRPWFAMTDGDWPRLKAGFEAWLRPENFDAGGQQRGKLAF